jgi:hypothetical protein
MHAHKGSKVEGGKEGQSRTIENRIAIIIIIIIVRKKLIHLSLEKHTALRVMYYTMLQQVFYSRKQGDKELKGE